MTRNQKLNKLGNAIRNYIGAYARHHNSTKDNEKKHWLCSRKPDQEHKVITWLIKCNLHPVDDLRRIKNFKSWNDLNAWMKTL